MSQIHILNADRRDQGIVCKRLRTRGFITKEMHRKLSSSDGFRRDPKGKSAVCKDCERKVNRR